MSATSAQPQVTIHELADALAVPPQVAITLATRAGATPQPGWQGALTIPASIATKVLEDHKQEQTADHLRRVDAIEARKRWEMDRRAAYSSAYRTAFAEVLMAQRRRWAGQWRRRIRR